MFRFLDLIPKWLWISMVLSLTVMSGGLFYQNGQLEKAVLTAEKDTAIAKGETSDVRAQHSKQVSDSDKAHSDELDRVRKSEQSLQATMDNQRRKLNETTAALASARDDLRVRFLPSSPGAPTATGPNGSGPGATTLVGPSSGLGTPTEFSDPIGDLIDEATRAETIREALVMCYRSYENAQKALAAPPVTTQP